MESLDVLAIVAHPDDAEISAGGALLKLIAEGKRCGIVDLTRGELGTRGTAETRQEEAEEASRRMRLTVRENLGLADGFFRDDEATQRRIIEVIRAWRPLVVITNAPTDRHPDHGRAGKLVAEACFYAGLPKIETIRNGVLQQSWRPKNVFHMIQDYYIQPDFVIDVTDHWEQKMEVLRSFKTQFYDPNSSEPKTPISGKEFFDYLHARSVDVGRPAGYALGEGFVHSRLSGVKDFFVFD